MRWCIIIIINLGLICWSDCILSAIEKRRNYFQWTWNYCVITSISSKLNIDFLNFKVCRFLAHVFHRFPINHCKSAHCNKSEDWVLGLCRFLCWWSRFFALSVECWLYWLIQLLYYLRISWKPRSIAIKSPNNSN